MAARSGRYQRRRPRRVVDEGSRDRGSARSGDHVHVDMPVPDAVADRRHVPSRRRRPRPSSASSATSSQVSRSSKASTSDLSGSEGEGGDGGDGESSDSDAPRWREQLYEALVHGDTRTVSRVLAAHGNPVNDPLFATGSPGTGLTIRGAATTLHVAAWAGQVPMCEWLLRQGADPKARDGLHMTPADCASSTKVVELLARSNTYKRKRRVAQASVSIEQRLVSLEQSIRRLQFGGAAVGGAAGAGLLLAATNAGLTGSHAPAGTGGLTPLDLLSGVAGVTPQLHRVLRDFDTRLDELRQQQQDGSEAGKQGLEEVLADVSDMKRRLRSIAKTARNQSVADDFRLIQMTTDELRIQVAALQRKQRYHTYCTYFLFAFVVLAIAAVVVIVVVGV